MVSFYPGWLGLEALREFFTITVLGHVTYGAVLGFTARSLIRRDPVSLGQGAVP